MAKHSKQVFNHKILSQKTFYRKKYSIRIESLDIPKTFNITKILKGPRRMNNRTISKI